MVKKISIIGAGNVGSNLAFHILSKLDLKELVLLDISGDLAKGIALDLEDTRAFLNFSSNVIGTHNWQNVKDSDIVVIACGKARKEGQTRYDLLKDNIKIAREVSLKIKKVAPFSIVVVITNPVDFITYVVKKTLGFERERVMGMGGILDQARFINLLYKEIKIHISCIDTLVVGFHSKDMIPLLSKTKIKNIDAENLIDKEKLRILREKTKERGAQIVQFLKTRSAYFAPSLSAFRLIEAIVKDKKEILPVSVYVEGEYGLRDICIGLPCIIGRGGIVDILEIELSKEEKEELLKTEKIFEECMT